MNTNAPSSHRPHPLQQTFERVNNLSSYVRPSLGMASDPQWTAPCALFEPGSPQLDALVAQTQEHVRTTNANVVGSALLQQYQWMITATALACFLTDQRLPDLRPQNVRLHVSTSGGSEALTFVDSRFFALRNDPAVNHSDAQVVADAATLRDQMRLDLEEHMTPLIHALQRRLGCKLRGLWLTLADRIANNLVWLMQERSAAVSLAEVQRELAALLSIQQSPLHMPKLRLFELSHQGVTRVFLERATCCFWYRQEGGNYCATCPHRTKQDRNEQLLKWMAQEHENSQTN